MNSVKSWHQHLSTEVLCITGTAITGTPEPVLVEAL